MVADIIRWVIYAVIGPGFSSALIWWLNHKFGTKVRSLKEEHDALVERLNRSEGVSHDDDSHDRVG